MTECTQEGDGAMEIDLGERAATECPLSNIVGTGAYSPVRAAVQSVVNTPNVDTSNL